MVEVVVASRHGSPSQVGRARRSLTSLSDRSCADGKEHVWCDIGLAGVVLPDDVGDDRGQGHKELRKEEVRPSKTVGPLVEIEAPAAVDQDSCAELRCGRGCFGVLGLQRA